jgi:hypothetical protein
MRPFASIFLDFNLPNAATWFYLSLILAVGLFIKFSRFFSIRNLDILSLYLLVPGFLLIQEGNKSQSNQLSFYGYIWLTAGSLWFFARCLWDLTLVGRPSIGTNLNLSGLAWMGGALFVCMIPVAARQPADLQRPVGTRTMAIDVLDKAGNQTVDEVQKHLAGAEHNEALTRFWVERSVALTCHLAVIIALIMIGAIHFQNLTAGVAAATFYLLLPYTAFHVGQVHHVFPAALLVWAIYCYRRAWLSGLLLGLASGTCFFPALTLPIWLSFYRRGGMRRFIVAFGLTAGVSLALTGVALWWEGSLSQSLLWVARLPDWQPWKMPGPNTIWYGVHGAYRLPVFILYAAFVITTSFWPSPKNLAHVVALSAAALIGIQFWYADHGGEYVLWYLPLVVLLVFRPNLADRYPPPQNPLPTWPSRSARRLADWVANRLQPADPAAKV